MVPVKNIHDFKAGRPVKVYNGNRLEGKATIIKALPDDHLYLVHFDEDEPSERFRRYVLPEWQEPGYRPQA